MGVVQDSIDLSSKPASPELISGSPMPRPPSLLIPSANLVREESVAVHKISISKIEEHDIVFKCGKVQWRASSVVVRNNCPRLDRVWDDRLFNVDCPISDADGVQNVDLTGRDPTTVQRFLVYLYTHEVPHFLYLTRSCDAAFALMPLAEDYEVTELATKAKDWLLNRCKTELRHFKKFNEERKSHWLCWADDVFSARESPCKKEVRNAIVQELSVCGDLVIRHEAGEDLMDECKNFRTALVQAPAARIATK